MKKNWAISRMTAFLMAFMLLFSAVGMDMPVYGAEAATEASDAGIETKAEKEEEKQEENEEEKRETDVSETTAPETTASETTAPETTASETTAPETTTSETTAPETTASETTVPETTVTETTAPETTASETTDSEPGNREQETEPEAPETEDTSTESIAESDESMTESSAEEAVTETVTEASTETETGMDKESAAETELPETPEETQPETQEETVPIVLEAIPEGTDVHTLNISSLGLNGAVSSMDVDEYFSIDGGGEVSDESVPANSCNFSKYLKMSAGSSIRMKNVGSTADIFVYAAGDTDGAALQLIGEDGTVAGSWTVGGPETITLHTAAGIRNEAGISYSLQVAEGTARVYCVALKTEQVIEETEFALAATELNASNYLKLVPLGEGTIPVLFDCDYNGNGYSIQSFNMNIKKTTESAWQTFSPSNSYGAEYFFFALEPDSVYEFSYNLELVNGEDAYFKGTVATGAAEAQSAAVTEVSANLRTDVGANLSAYATTNSQFAPDGGFFQGMAYGHYFYLGEYSYIVSPTVVGEGTIPVYFDIGYYRNNKEQTGLSAVVNIRKEGSQDWIRFNNTLDGSLPLYSLEPNTTYEFCYVLNVAFVSTPYVTGTLTTDDTVASGFSIQNIGGMVKRSKGIPAQICSGDDNPASSLFEGSYFYLGDYDFNGSASAITIITDNPINAQVRLYSEDGWEIPAGWVWTGGANNDQPYKWNYYILESGTVRYVIEAEGYASATGTMNIGKSGSSINGYTEDTGGEAESVELVTSSTARELHFQLKSQEAGKVTVTLDNTIDQNISIALYDDENQEILPVSGEGKSPSVYMVDVPEYGEDGAVVTKIYRYVMSAEGYTTYEGYFGVTSDKKVIQISAEDDEKYTTECHFNSAGYYISIVLIPETQVSTKDGQGTSTLGKLEIGEIKDADGNLTDGNHVFTTDADGNYIEDPSLLNNSDTIIRLPFSDAINENHFNVESFEETGKMVISNQSDVDWEIVGYYCNTKNGDGSYNHDTTLRVINHMNCDLYGVSYGQNQLTMQQLRDIETEIEKKYSGDPLWQQLFGSNYSYYNYLVYWFRTADENQLAAAGITGNYSEIQSLEELSEADFSKIIYPDSGLDVWFNYNTGYRTAGDMTLAECKDSTKIYTSTVNSDQYAPLETDSRLDELIKAMAYENNYSFALDGSFKGDDQYYEGAVVNGKDYQNLYITYQQYEDGVPLEYILEQLGTGTLSANDSILLSNMKYRVEINGCYSNVFQERDFAVQFGLYVVPVWKLKIQKLDETDSAPLSGVTFEVKYPDGTSHQYTTDANGLIDLRGTAAGTYTIREVTGLDGYIPNEDEYSAVITATETGCDIAITRTNGNGALEYTTREYTRLDDPDKTEKAVTLTLKNKKNSIVIRKVDQAGNPVSGAGLKLSSADGTVIREWTSSEQDETFTGLTAGDYVLTETSAPAGYVTAAPMNITVTGSENGKEFAMVNEVTKVSVIKLDKETKQPLAGAELVVRDSTGAEIDRWTTTESTHKLEMLPVGSYTLSEEKAPEGYEKAADVVFEVVDSPEEILVTMEDAPLIPVPEPPAAGNAAISVTKKITYQGTEIFAREQTFYLALFEDQGLTNPVTAEKAAVLKDASEATVEFTGLEAGKSYYVGETDGNGNVVRTGTLGDGGVFEAQYSDATGASVEQSGGTAHIDLVNEFYSLPTEGFYWKGILVLTKRVQDENGEAVGSDETFYAGIFEDSGYTVLSEQVNHSIIAFEMNGNAVSEQIVDASGSIDGLKLYITEVDENGIPVKDGSEFGYTLQMSKESVTLDSGHRTDSVELINTAVNSESEEDSTELDTEEDSTEPETEENSTEPNTEESEKAVAAKTGDDTPVGSYLMLLFAAAGVFIFEEKKRRRI